LVVGAHPDDEVLGMGGTVARHALHEGCEVVVLCVSDGSSSQCPVDGDQLRRKHDGALAAAEILGVREYIQHDLPGSYLNEVPHVEVNKVVEELVSDFRPGTVYTVHPDVNLDHRSVFRSVMVATRPRAGSSVRRVLTFATRSSIEWTAPFESSFRPNWFTDISATIDDKIAAFECYETERRAWPHPRTARSIRVTAESCGASVGCDFAEEFTLVRYLDF
jgi:LmbE family N-acetylglucosaminyl deacetylase